MRPSPLLSDSLCPQHSTTLPLQSLEPQVAKCMKLASFVTTGQLEIIADAVCQQAYAMQHMPLHKDEYGYCKYAPSNACSPHRNRSAMLVQNSRPLETINNNVSQKRAIYVRCQCLCPTALNTTHLSRVGSWPLLQHDNTLTELIGTIAGWGMSPNGK